MRKQSSRPVPATRQASAARRSADEASGAGQAALAGATSRRYAQGEDQVPPASLDDAWANLHPARIWPD